MSSTEPTGYIQIEDPERPLGQRSEGSEHGLMPLHARRLKFRLTGLQPGGSYFYRVHAAPITFNNAYDIRRGEAVATPVYRFTTLDPSARTTSLSNSFEP